MQPSYKPKKAIIIGSGIAGLAIAIRLACKGFEVEVFEKNSFVGGKIHEIENGGFKFDAGPSLFTQPYLIEELFALANEPIEDYFQYQSVDLCCKYFYEDGTIINAFADKEKFASELAEKNNEDKEDVLKYLAEAKKLYNYTGNFFLEHSLHKASSYFFSGFFKLFYGAKYKYVAKSLHQLNTSRFNHFRSIQLFNRFATYNGSNPYKAPGMLSVIAHIEHNEGIFYPMNGMISIVNALYRLALKKGVQFHLNTAVDKIMYHNNSVNGIVVENKNHEADMVISNADIYFTYKNLLGNDVKAKKILKQERSSSAIVFYWGMNKTFNELNLHNIFFSEDYQAEFNSMFKKKSIYRDPTIYINITSKMELAKFATNGNENWFVMINVPANIGQDWVLLQQELRTAVINKLSRILKADIESFIETESCLNPIELEKQTASFMGSIYGSSSNSKLSAFLRHKNYSSELKGLYFVGGSVHPGGGIPLCLRSAAIVESLIES